MEQLFSVLIHKSVENDVTDKLICGAIWICGLSHFINQIIHITENIDAE